MTRETTDNDTAEQVIESFRVLAGDKVTKLAKLGLTGPFNGLDSTIRYSSDPELQIRPKTFSGIFSGSSENHLVV